MDLKNSKKYSTKIINYYSKNTFFCSYSSPYSYEMPASSTSYIPSTGMAMASPQIQSGHMNGGNPGG